MSYRSNGQEHPAAGPESYAEQEIVHAEGGRSIVLVWDPQAGLFPFACYCLDEVGPRVRLLFHGLLSWEEEFHIWWAGSVGKAAANYQSLSREEIVGISKAIRAAYNLGPKIHTETDDMAGWDGDEPIPID